MWWVYNVHGCVIYELNGYCIRADIELGGFILFMAVYNSRQLFVCSHMAFNGYNHLCIYVGLGRFIVTVLYTSSTS